jgi:hypothetical protein
MLTQVIFSSSYRGKSFVGSNGATYYLMDGQAIPRSTNGDLAALWPTAAYGGDATNIHLPPCENIYLRGYDFGSSRDVDATSRIALSGVLPTGDTIGAYQAGNMKSHVHASGTQTGTGPCADSNGQNGGSSPDVPNSSQTSTSISLVNSAYTNVVISGSTANAFDVANCSFFVYIEGN